MTFIDFVLDTDDTHDSTSAELSIMIHRRLRLDYGILFEIAIVFITFIHFMVIFAHTAHTPLPSPPLPTVLS